MKQKANPEKERRVTSTGLAAAAAAGAPFFALEVGVSGATRRRLRLAEERRGIWWECAGIGAGSVRSFELMARVRRIFRREQGLFEAEFPRFRGRAAEVVILLGCDSERRAA